MITSYDILENLIRTEKSVGLIDDRKYTFRISKYATKIDIKRAVEEIYKVKVEDVNVLTVKGKKRRVRKEYGYAPNWRKAIVTLKEGEKIEVA